MKGGAGPVAVGLAQSSRLREMREKVNAGTPLRPDRAAAKISADKQSQGLSPELLLARQLIDQRLAEILAGLPAGKQRSLFKIRFGVEIEQIKHLPIRGAVSLLAINHPDLLSSSPVMKRVAALNYEGEIVD